MELGIETVFSLQSYSQSKRKAFFLYLFLHHYKAFSFTHTSGDHRTSIHCFWNFLCTSCQETNFLKSVGWAQHKKMFSPKLDEQIFIFFGLSSLWRNGDLVLCEDRATPWFCSKRDLWGGVWMGLWGSNCATLCPGPGQGSLVPCPLPAVCAQGLGNTSSVFGVWVLLSI